MKTLPLPKDWQALEPEETLHLPECCHCGDLIHEPDENAVQTKLGILHRSCAEIIWPGGDGL